MKGHPREIRIVLTVLALAASGCLASSFAAASETHGDMTPSEVIAAVVVKLAAFAEWPVPAEPGLTICLYDGGSLSAALATHQGRPARDGIVVVRRVSLPVAVSGCHVALVGGEGVRRLERLSEAYRGRPVLVVAEGADAIDQGAMVGLDISSGRVVFDVNRTAASSEGMVLSSKLLRLARRVR